MKESTTRAIEVGHRYRARQPGSRIWRVTGIRPAEGDQEERILCVCDETKETYKFARKNIGNPSIYDLVTGE